MKTSKIILTAIEEGNNYLQDIYVYVRQRNPELTEAAIRKGIYNLFDGRDPELLKGRKLVRIEPGLYALDDQVGLATAKMLDNQIKNIVPGEFERFVDNNGTITFEGDHCDIIIRPLLWDN